MNTESTRDVGRRKFLRNVIWLPVSAAAWMLSGCALPMLMKANTRKISQKEFSCGEDCPHAVKESSRH